MVQSTDLTLSNQSGANYRAEHNSINSALGSTHKGSTAPTYAIAGLPWVDDTSTPWVFKIYDGTDWIKIGDIDPTANTFTPANAVSLGTDNTFTGKFAFADEGELTIATGAITITAAFHTVDTEADAASDDLATINGGADGEILVIRPANDARSVVIKHGTGNIATAGGSDITLSSTDQAAVLIYDAEKVEWVVISAPVTIASQVEAEAGTNNTKVMTPLRTGEQRQALIHLRDEKTSGTSGGAATAGSWQTRTLNTVVTNNITGASLASNTVTLPAGKYFVSALSPFYRVGGVSLRLRKVSATASTLVDGLTSFAQNGTDSTQIHAPLNGLMELPSGGDVELQYYANAAVVATALGRSQSIGTEVYSELIIRKVG